MPYQVIPQIISLQFSPQNNLEILAHESRQNLDRDEKRTILQNFASPVKISPNIYGFLKFLWKLHHQSEEINLQKFTNFLPCFNLKIFR